MSVASLTFGTGLTPPALRIASNLVRIVPSYPCSSTRGWSSPQGFALRTRCRSQADCPAHPQDHRPAHPLDHHPAHPRGRRSAHPLDHRFDHLLDHHRGAPRKSSLSSAATRTTDQSLQRRPSPGPGDIIHRMKDLRKTGLHFESRRDHRRDSRRDLRRDSRRDHRRGHHPESRQGNHRGPDYLHLLAIDPVLGLHQRYKVRESNLIYLSRQSCQGPLTRWHEVHWNACGISLTPPAPQWGWPRPRSWHRGPEPDSNSACIFEAHWCTLAHPG